MKFFRQFFLILLLAFTGCATSQVVLPTKTFDDKYASANATLTAINKATTSALHAKAIPAKTAQEVLNRSRLVGKTLDIAFSMKNASISTALSKLGEVNQELSDLKTLLASVGVKI